MMVCNVLHAFSVCTKVSLHVPHRQVINIFYGLYLAARRRDSTAKHRNPPLFPPINFFSRRLSLMNTLSAFFFVQEGRQGEVIRASERLNGARETMLRTLMFSKYLISLDKGIPKASITACFLLRIKTLHMSEEKGRHIRFYRVSKFEYLHDGCASVNDQLQKKV